jgi:hypothetical protein
VDLYELNEAFAAAAIAVTRALRLDPAKVNVNGGAVAIGHPIGASGARILTTLLYEMQRRNVHRGIAALCLGGGNAVALAVESDSADRDACCSPPLQRRAFSADATKMPPRANVFAAREIPAHAAKPPRL